MKTAITIKLLLIFALGSTAQLTSTQAAGSEQSTQLVKRIIQAAPTTLGAPATFGQWSDVMPWPVIAVHATLLPNGRVMAWDATPDDFDDNPHTTANYTTRVTVWDPQTNFHTSANNDTNADLFCAGTSHLWDGRILFAGGDSGIDGANGPLSNSSIYNPRNNAWTQMPDMASPRWYSSNAALPNGETLTFAGRYDPAPIAEVFQHNGTWRSLSFAEPAGLSINYQWMQTTPAGTVMAFGPQNRLFTIDPNAEGRLKLGPSRDQYPLRRYGSYAMYDIGKVLVTGGTEDEGGLFSYDSSVIIDTSTQQTTDTSDMTFARTQHNLTILADGTVLASGGNSDGGRLIDLDSGVLQPEIWSPITGQWQVMNNMQIDRQYHSVALLLPDGRVLSAGGGYCGDCYEQGYEERNAEVFSPPYLFSTGNSLAIRPVINQTPNRIDYDEIFNVVTDSANDIERAHLIKLGSVTHSQNQDQRLVPSAFDIQENTLLVRSPLNRNIAPPGDYMLFLVDSAGVPSEAKIVRVGQPLIKSGEDVSHTVVRGDTDQYVFQADNAADEIVVGIKNHTANTTIKVIAAGTTRCQQTASPGQMLECRISDQMHNRWIIEISATNTSSYVLTGLSIGSTANTLTNGGGTFSIVMILLLSFKMCLRRCVFVSTRCNHVGIVS